MPRIVRQQRWWYNVSTRTAVVIVDDQKVVRQQLRRLIDAQPGLSVVGEAATGVGGVQCVDGTAAEVLVLDLDLPDISGFEVLRRVLRSRPLLRVLVFSSYPTKTFGPLLLQAGAAAYVCKGAGSPAMLEALQSITRGFEGGSRP